MIIILVNYNWRAFIGRAIIMIARHPMGLDAHDKPNSIVPLINYPFRFATLGQVDNRNLQLKGYRHAVTPMTGAAPLC